MQYVQDLFVHMPLSVRVGQSSF